MLRRPRRGFGRRQFTYPEVGTLFDERYQLEAVIGTGGGSMVFRALDTRLNRLVALKIIAPDEMDIPGLARFEREARSIARLSHPSIVTIHDFSEFDGQPYLVLELVNGQDLWALIYEREALLSLEASLKIGIHILDALVYAHEREVIHRDLKPENVMVIDDDFNIKVMDFGLAYIRGQKRITSDGVISGSAFYMAPEVAEGKSSDHRADLYALGVMLYELMTGRLPFYSENPIAVINQHLYEVPFSPSSLNSDISPALETVILKLLAKRPEDRFDSANTVRKALLQQDQQPISVITSPANDLTNRINRAKPAGREAEWARLRTCWQQIQVGALNARPVVIIAGEAGSGKTQFTQDLLMEARLSGAITLIGQCYQSDANLPYRPFTEILRDYLRDHPDPIPAAIAADLVKLVPELSVPAEKLPSLSPEAERLRLFEHVTQFLVDITRKNPVVLLLEDLHYADLSSIALLEYIARHSQGHPLLIIGTYRPSEIDHQHPLDATLRDLSSRDRVERLALHRLNREHVQAFVESILGNQVDPSFSQVFYEKTEGNLFFIKELLKAVVADGSIRFDEASRAWICKLDEIELPGSIRSIIGQQISKLSEAAHDMLGHAAVIGRVFSFDLLKAVLGMDEDALLEKLDEALAAHLIYEKKGSREETYIFENSSIRQTLLANLNQRHKARLHLKIAKVLETQHPADNMLETLARHYSLGARTNDDIDTAINYLLKAADWARGIFALPDALELYNQALDLSQDDASPERETRILLLRERRGMVSQQVGDFVTATTDLEFVLQVPDVSSDLPRKRHVLLQLGEVYRRREQFEAAIKTLTEAVEISRQMGNERFVANTLYFLGATYWSWGEITKSVAHQEEGYQIVRQFGLQDKVAMRVLHGLAESYLRQGKYARMVELARESLALAEKFGDAEFQAENLPILGAAELDRGNYHRAQAVFEQGLEVARRADLRLHYSFLLTSHGRAKAVVGDYQAGLQILKQAHDLSREYQYKGITMTRIWDYMGCCYYELDLIALAAENFSAARDCAQRHQISWSAAFTIAHWGMAQIRLGNLDVGALLETTLEDSLSRGDLAYIPGLYQALAMLEIARENPQKALKWAENLYILATELTQRDQIAYGYYWQAQALAQLGRNNHALEALEKAVEIAASLTRPRLMWDLHQALADIYVQIGDLVKAKRHQTRVKDIIESILEDLTDPALKQGLIAKLKKDFAA